MRLMLCNPTKGAAEPNQIRDFATTKTQNTQHTFRCALLPMRLHGDMRIQMIQGTIRLLTSLPPALVHSLDFFVAATRALVLLGTRNRDKGIDLGQRVRILGMILNTRTNEADAQHLPGQCVVQQSPPARRRRPRFPESCKGHQASDAGDLRTVAATLDTHGAGDPDIEPCRGRAGRRESREDRWDWRRLWRDL